MPATAPSPKPASTQPAGAAIEARDLHKVFGQREVVRRG